MNTFQIIMVLISTVGLIYFVASSWVEGKWSVKAKPTVTKAGKIDRRRELLDHLLIVRDEVADGDKTALDGVGKDILAMPSKDATPPVEPAK